MPSFSSLIAAVGVLNLATALSPAQWRSQSIYQVLTDRFATPSGSTTTPCNPADMVYCGGTWSGLMNNLDYIQGMGFTAIWISPVPQNADGGYHGYWQQNMYEVNNNFGSAADLHALSNAVHARGMYLMVDIVTNHVGFNGARNAVDYTQFRPFNDPSYYHQPCEIDYNNMTSIVYCWEGDNVVALPDLKTETPEIVAEFQSWIQAMVSNYTIDGIRLDSGMEIDVEFYLPFQEAAGVYVMAEVADGNPSELCSYQEYNDGPLNYVAYFWINRAFGSQSYGFQEIAWGINMLQDECADTTLLGSFMENHDEPRFPSTQSDMVLAQNAIAFTILQDGIPIIYQGQEQHFSGGANPLNREALWPSKYNTQATLYQWIKQINNVRNYITSISHDFVTYYNTAIYHDNSTLITRKGDNGMQLVSIFTNVGTGPSKQTRQLVGGDTGFEPNQYIIDTISCTVYQADVCGNVTVTITNGLPVALFPALPLKGSNICQQDSAQMIAMPTPAPENLGTSVIPTSTLAHSTSVMATSSVSSIKSASASSVGTSSKNANTSVSASSSSHASSASSSAATSSKAGTTTSPAASSATNKSSAAVSSSSASVQKSSSAASSASRSAGSATSATNNAKASSSSTSIAKPSSAASAIKTTATPTTTAKPSTTAKSSTPVKPVKVKTPKPKKTKSKKTKAVKAKATAHEQLEVSEIVATTTITSLETKTILKTNVLDTQTILKTRTNIRTATTTFDPLSTSTATKKNLAKRSQTSSACNACITAVAVTFSESMSSFGALDPDSRVELVGSTPSLSSWNANLGVQMTNGTGGVWSQRLVFTPGQVIQYKYVVVDIEGSVQWEADPNHTFTVPTGCTSTVSVANAWQTWAS